MRFDWDPDKNELNIRRHGVSFEEAQEAFFDSNALEEYDEKHSTTKEPRFNLVGLSSFCLETHSCVRFPGILFPLCTAERCKDGSQGYAFFAYPWLIHRTKPAL